MDSTITVAGTVLRRERDPIPAMQVWSGSHDALEGVEIVARYLPAMERWSVSVYVVITADRTRVTSLAVGWGATRAEAEREMVGRLTEHLCGVQREAA